MRKIYEKLMDNIPSLINVLSLSGDGKTTLLTSMTVEGLCDGKKILFITGEVRKKIIVERVSEMLRNHKSNMVRNSSLKIIDSKNMSLNDSIYTTITNNKYDIIIVDSILDKDLAGKLHKIAIDYNCIVMFSSQLNRSLLPNAYSPIFVMQKSDICLSITKTSKPTLLTNLKYFFCFWLKKPNRTIKLVKNRYGKQSTHDVFIDFPKQ